MLIVTVPIMRRFLFCQLLVRCIVGRKVARDVVKIFDYQVIMMPMITNQAFS
jgi:hypothetical protein